MSRIKTRENAKDIKVLDKSTVVSQHMKNAFIRSKREAELQTDDREAGPDEYAVNRVGLTADEFTNNAANVATSETKSAVRQGQKLFRRQREKKAEGKRGQNTASTEQTSSLETDSNAELAPEGSFLQQCNDAIPETRHPIQRQNEARHMQQVKKPTGQTDRPPQIKSKGVSKAPRQIKTTAKAVDTPIRAIKQPIRKMGQTAKATGRSAKSTVESAQRTVKTAQRTVKETAKTAERTSKVTIKTAEQTAKTAQKTAQADAKATQVAVQAARAATKAAAASAKAAAKATAETVKAAAAAIKELVVVIAAGGWVAVLVIVIICLIGLIVGSCFGIFFSGQNSSTATSLTMTTVVQELNQEFEAMLEGIESNNAHDVLEMAGSDIIWPDVLAVYAVKTTTDPNDSREVATMDETKKELLKELFWTMNEVSSRTETNTVTQTMEAVDGEGNTVEEEVEVTITTLYITVTHKTAGEMADVYNFTAEQRQQLAELLAEENREMWSSVLNEVGPGDG